MSSDPENIRAVTTAAMREGGREGGRGRGQGGAPSLPKRIKWAPICGSERSIKLRDLNHRLGIVGGGEMFLLREMFLLAEGIPAQHSGPHAVGRPELTTHIQ